MSHNIRLFFVLVLTAWLALGNLVPAPAAAPAAQSAAGDLLQLSAGGHMLGLGTGSVIIAARSHALRIDFSGASPVQPETAQPAAAPGKSAAPLEQAAWENLWPGIRLEYRAAASGIAESVYTLQPGADVGRIRLRYNAPVSIGEDGALVTRFEDGEMSESAPIAWQEIGGRRIAVQAAFRIHPRTNEVGFSLGRHDPAYPVTIDPVLVWTSFLGGADDDDRAEAVALDASGNVYIAGYSFIPWGAPQRAYSYLYDGYISKLNSSGGQVWMTYLGGWGNDMAYAIAVDANGNVYAGGYSDATWGSPVRAFNWGDGWVARLDSAGAVQWNTFLGGIGSDTVYDLAVTPGGIVFAVGISGYTWGTPVTPFISGGYDAFTVRLVGSTGALTWNTFTGGTGEDRAMGVVATDTTLYIAGRSDAPWGSPVRAYSGGRDAFAAKINPASGALVWSTFLGGPGGDYGEGLALDAGGNLYVSGISENGWGSPVRAFSGGGSDAFAAKLNSSGQLVWNTFLGASGADTSHEIAVDAYGSAFVAGDSCYVSWGSPLILMAGNCPAYLAQLNTTSGALGWNTFLNGSSGGSYSVGTAVAVQGSNLALAGTSNRTWGTPVRSFSGNPEAYAAQFSLSGILIWNTFMGGSPDDFVLGIDVDNAGNTYVTGYTNAGWGTPVRGYSYRADAFVARLDPAGALAWLTFLGGSGSDYAYGLHRDGAGALLVVGSSTLSWGAPLRTFGGGNSDAFVASLDETDGSLTWNTFLGGSGNESAYAVTTDYTTNVWLTGYSNATWGTPVRAYSSGADGFAAKVNYNGVLMWNTFLGGAGSEVGYAITVDDGNHLYLAGSSNATWGSPTHAHAGGSDAYAAYLAADTGSLVWNTFVGSSGSETGYGIAIDSTNYLLVAGDTSTGWMTLDDGSTLDGMARPDGGGGGVDGYVTRINPTTGALSWTAFVGGTANDYGYALATGPAGKIYLAGNTVAAWQKPTAEQPDLTETLELLAAVDGAPAMLLPEGGGSGTPAYVTELNSLGAITATRFVGGEGSSYATAVAVGSDGAVYLAGYSPAVWGAGQEYYHNGWDGYVTRIDMRQFVFLPALKRKN